MLHSAVMTQNQAILSAHNQTEYTVSEISQSLKRLIEQSYSHVRVRGEVSGYRGPHSSGHCYFSLKDDKAKIDAIIWKGQFAKMKIRPEEGMEVIATGQLSSYPSKSGYQMIIESMEPAGAGALMALLEKRKAALAAEGLFDEARKQPLPMLPQRIGVVTSPTGAVIRDILHRIADRFPNHVLVWPVRVQGEGAAAEIAAAINGFNHLPDHLKPDVIIVARGGGSLEDLWCFNEEIVVRAAAASFIPLISAVGHETDTTLIDFASDVRAPTPTAAAEMVVPVRAEWVLTLQDHATRLNRQIIRQLHHWNQHTQLLGRALPTPSQMLSLHTQQLDSWSERLTQSLPVLLQQKTQKLSSLIARHQPHPLLQRLHYLGEKSSALAARMVPGLERSIDQRHHRLQMAVKLFDSLNLQAVLSRGFALIQDSEGKAITSHQALQKQLQTPFLIRMHDGQSIATLVTESELPS